MNKIVDTKALLKGSRSVWKDSMSHIGTSKHGKIIPVYFKEMLPGQNFKPSTGLSIRMNPLISPIFDDIFADVYWFWVPYRIIWNQSKQFFGENDVKAWTQTKKLQMPHGSCTLADLNSAEQSLGDYIYGSLQNITGSGPTANKVSADDVNDLPLRAYIEIYNQWFRNQNVIDPVLYNKDFESTSDNDYDFLYSNEPLNACRLHDIAETLLPQPQKGDAVTLGIADFAPLGILTNADSPHTLGYSLKEYDSKTSKWLDNGDINPQVVFGRDIAADNNYWYSLGNFDSISSGQPGGTLMTGSNENSPSNFIPIGNENFKTNLVANLTNATAVTIQDLYYAECLERFRYLLGIGGSRYQEFLRTMFGVVPNSEILDVPELLHSKRIKLNISQVVSHSETQIGSGDGTSVIPIGEVAGMSWTNDRTVNCFNKYCGEHGLIMAVMVTRHPTTYAQKIHPFAFKKDLLDIYVPPFANIYDVPFFTKYIYPYLALTDTRSILSDTLGFASPWWDYKHEMNQVSGYMNPIFAGSLKTFSLATVYSSKPTLSKEFVEESRQSILRVTAGDFDFDYMWSFYVEYETAVRMNPDAVPGDIIGKVGV